MNTETETNSEDIERITCDDCGHVCDPENGEELTAVADDSEVCEVCRDDNYCWVEDRAAWFPNSDCVSTGNGDAIHMDDAIDCADCGESFHIHASDMCYVEGVGDVCSGCLEYSDNYCVPEDGDGYYLIDRCHMDDDGYFWLTPPNRALRCYSTNVFDILNRRAYVEGRSVENFDSLLVFGVELETASRDNYASDIAESLLESTDFGDYGICKEDGSVSGPELVTLPADLDSHKSKYAWDEWCASLRPIARGYYGGSGTGMHVHINRRAVGPLTLGKMLVFMNARENGGLISTIAQREIDGNRWCEANPHKFDKVGKSARDPYNGKYSVLNVTRSTIECRIFRSTLLPERILKNLEFCHALVRFCENTSARNLRDRDFIGYVAAKRVEYPNLHEFITARYNAQ